VVVHDRNPHKLRALKKEFGVAVEPDLLACGGKARLMIVPCGHTMSRAC